MHTKISELPLSQFCKISTSAQMNCQNIAINLTTTMSQPYFNFVCFVVTWTEAA